jgi:hypothetical protein
MSTEPSPSVTTSPWAGLRKPAVAAWLAAALFAAMLVLTLPLAPSLPVLQLSFNPEAFAGVQAAWTAQGEGWRFGAHFWLDVPFLLAYGWAGWCWRQTQPLAGLLLVGAALADLLEDGLHLCFLAWPRGAPEELYLVAGWAAMVKFKLWAVAGLVAWVRWRRRRQRDV